MEEVDKVVQLTLDNTEIYPVEFREARKRVVRKFPYNIIYTILNLTTIYIISVLNTGQDTSIWKNWLKP